MYDTNYVVAIDFDNTITQGTTYEHTGTLNPIAKKYIEKIKQLGCVTVLWTTRDGEDLIEAINLLKEWNMMQLFDYINNYPLRNSGNKINVDFYIDDKSWITPIDWKGVYKFIEKGVNKNATI